MRKLLLLITLAVGAGAAHADNGTLYLGAGLANDNLRDIAATNSNLAVEANYIDLGSESVAAPGGGTTHLSYKAFAGYAVGYAPIPIPWIDVFGKVGLARWTSSGSSSLGAPPGLFSLSDNGSQFAWGVGGQVHVGNVGARLEYENFNIRNTGGANIVSLSAFLNLY
jgi:hypothetical protein